jgi:cytochrome c553
MKEAHAGVLSSSNPQSRVYYKNIPSTCGRCHGAEFYKFTQSYHYKKLEATGRGPNCVTCHGSMVTSVLNPDDIANVCARCHNKRIGVFPYVPQKAKAVLLLLRESKALLAADKKLYKSEKGSANASYLQKAQSSLYSAKLEWHRFDLDSIIRHLEQMDNSIRRLSPKVSHP